MDENSIELEDRGNLFEGASHLDFDETSSYTGDDTYEHLEERYELMNSSLIALTTHFAQVQFRLRQIVQAAPHEKEALLKNLEEFAFRGIPQVQEAICRKALPAPADNLEDTLITQRAKQAELIEKLKNQLAELEGYAYEVGEGGPPQSLVIERQKVIIDQLKGQLNLNVEGIDKMSPDELKRCVDNALGQLINPLKMKEQLVLQLKTQINDLERFVEFLQGDSTVKYVKDPNCVCSCSGCHQNISKSQDQMHGKVINIVRKISALLQIFASTHTIHTTRRFQRNSPKKAMRVKHWGDLRAYLEVAIENVIEIAKEPEIYADSDYMSDSESAVQCTSKLATVVRKHLAISLQNLIQHGLMSANSSLTIVPFTACFRLRPPPKEEEMHAWELILKFYEMKNGEKFNSTPARKLSQSFNLEITGGKAISAKQTLLSTIGSIISSHDVYKRSYDSHFKAFVCAGLNNKMLVQWLKLILRCDPLVELYYADWSYVVKTRFEDALASLEKLNQFQFNLPVDLSVRQLNDIKDAF